MPLRPLRYFVNGLPADPVTNPIPERPHDPAWEEYLHNDRRTNLRQYPQWLKPFNQAVRHMGILPARRDLDHKDITTPNDVHYSTRGTGIPIKALRRQARLQVRRLSKKELLSLLS